MHKFAFLLCGDWQVAEDIVQEAFARCALRWRRIERTDYPDGYLRKVVINECRSRWRRQLTKRVELGVDVDSPVSDHSTLHAERERIVGALRQLPHRQRSVIVLRFYERLSEAETAEALGCSIGTVKSQTHKALASLRRIMTLEEQAC